MWETTDRDGRRVLLTQPRWRHIADRHPELASSRVAILAAVASPVASRPGHQPSEEWFYALDGKIVITMPKKRVEATDLGALLAAV